MNHRLEDARAKAEELVELLRPTCHRIEIAGSIRRRRPVVKDIELVLVPKTFRRQAGLFDDDGSKHDASETLDLLNKLVDEGALEKRLDDRGYECWGFKHQRAVYKGIALDLFGVIEPAQWGVIFAVRTGPADFSRWFVTSVKAKNPGLMPEYMRVKDGALHRVGVNDEILMTLDTPEEKDFFAAIGFGAPEPWDREAPRSFTEGLERGW